MKFDAISYLTHPLIKIIQPIVSIATPLKIGILVIINEKMEQVDAIITDTGLHVVFRSVSGSPG